MKRLVYWLFYVLLIFSLLVSISCESKTIVEIVNIEKIEFIQASFGGSSKVLIYTDKEILIIYWTNLENKNIPLGKCRLIKTISFSNTTYKIEKVKD
jgi:hypothetical protein